MKQGIFIKKYIAMAIGVTLLNPVFYSMSALYSPSIYAAQAIESTLPITFKVNPGNPNIFNVSGSNKIVIDFIDYKGEAPTVASIVSDNPLIKGADIIKTNERMRVVVDTKSPARYNLEKNKNGFLLKLTKADNFNDADVKMNTIKPSVVPSSPVESKVSINPILPEPKVQKAPFISFTQLEKINVKKTAEKTAKVTIEFNRADYAPKIIKDGDNLLIDLKGVGIPSELQKNVNTRELGTLLTYVDIATQKNSGRVILAQKGDWDYSYYQSDKKLVVEIKPKEVQASIKPKYTGKPLTINFQNMDVRAVMQVIADFTGLNIMSSDTVQGSMSIRLKDVPWDQALDLILESKNLEKVQQGNVIWVATSTEISDKNKTKLELNQQKEELAPLSVEFFQLNHYKATEMKAVLEGDARALGNVTGIATGVTGGSAASKAGKDIGLISKRGSIGLDIRNNTIFVQDTLANLEDIRKVIKRLDVPTKQVIIEARLVVATDKFGRDLGAKFGIGGKKMIGDNQNIGIGNSLGESQNNAGGVITPGGSTAYNGGVTGGAIGFTILNAALGNFLSFELSALEKSNLGQVISSPRLITADNKKAIIRQGTQIPYTIPGNASSAPTVAFKDAVLSLGVTPQVSPNGRVNMALDISKDTIGQTVLLPGGGSVPSIDTRSILTDVTVNNGQTVVLGGVYEVSSTDDVQKVPFFGDIPFIGNLFKQKSKTNEKAELLIFITPHVVNDEDLDVINKDSVVPTEIDIKR